MKIMDYYKRIFTDKNGNQTSQIFAVTHSPFAVSYTHLCWRRFKALAPIMQAIVEAPNATAGI